MSYTSSPLVLDKDKEEALQQIEKKSEMGHVSKKVALADNTLLWPFADVQLAAAEGSVVDMQEDIVSSESEKKKGHGCNKGMENDRWSLCTSSSNNSGLVGENANTIQQVEQLQQQQESHDDKVTKTSMSTSLAKEIILPQQQQHIHHHNNDGAPQSPRSSNLTKKATMVIVGKTVSHPLRTPSVSISSSFSSNSSDNYHHEWYDT
mmetsp:Transcript_2410/g.3665  ORF Transcript_2410/g.3665 Transcript_2410/m.3665 type:complete len:206 (-) Transcript_2410:25-642(-)